MRRTLLLLLALVGCGESGPRQASDAPPRAEDRPSPREAAAAEDAPRQAGQRPARFAPVDLSGTSAEAASAASPTKSSRDDEKELPTVVAALQPFQILLGQWRYVTKKKFGEFPKTGDDVEWIWDFQTERGRPALAAASRSHPYFEQAWLTYLPADDHFQLTMVDRTAVRRTLTGTWAEGGEPREESDGRKLQRTYKLLLTQSTPAEGEQWQVTLQQLDNNQYLVDFQKRAPAGSRFGPLDTVRQQRVGTSFAVADSDNPGPKCIISGGLGSMNVTYKGKSYPVCCSGCAAAFNDDPERWLSRLAATPKPASEEE